MIIECRLYEKSPKTGFFDVELNDMPSKEEIAAWLLIFGHVHINVAVGKTIVKGDESIFFD